MQSTKFDKIFTRITHWLLTDQWPGSIWFHKNSSLSNYPAITNVLNMYGERWNHHHNYPHHIAPLTSPSPSQSPSVPPDSKKSKDLLLEAMEPSSNHRNYPHQHHIITKHHHHHHHHRNHHRPHLIPKSPKIFSLKRWDRRKWLAAFFSSTSPASPLLIIITVRWSRNWSGLR